MGGCRTVTYKDRVAITSETIGVDPDPSLTLVTVDCESRLAQVCRRVCAEPEGAVCDGAGVIAGSYVLRPIGWVESPLTDPDMAPRQGEGAPAAWVVFEPTVREGLVDLRVGAEVLLLTWLDRARRDVLVVHPRDDRTRPLTGVFSTRSQDRPNPIGLHRVRIASIEDTRIGVWGLEALHGTPVLDVKPLLDRDIER